MRDKSSYSLCVDECSFLGVGFAYVATRKSLPRVTLPHLGITFRIFFYAITKDIDNSNNVT